MLMEGGSTLNYMKVLGLIPTRLGSTRLPAKALLELNGMPLIIHTYRRSKLAKGLSDLIICCDNNKILKVAKKYKSKCKLTSVHHKNGTERIAEAYLSLKKNFDLIIDIQGDEPLISPYHIDQVIEFHKKNPDADIVLPTLSIKFPDSPNLIKVVTNNKKEVMYLSRSKIPFEFKRKVSTFKKHLSIISFKPDALIKFSKSKQTPIEKIEDIELIRALEIGLKIKSLELKGDSFSVDDYEDYLKAKDKMNKDKLFRTYKK